MTNQYIRLMLRAYNNECDAAILKVRWNNVTQMEERINRAFDSVNDLGRAQQIEVTPAYHKLRLEELYLTHEYQEKRNEEREEQRRIQEQIREEERAQREFEKAQKEAEAEELRQEKALEKARAELEKASGKELEGLTAKIVELEEKVRQA